MSSLEKIILSALGGLVSTGVLWRWASYAVRDLPAPVATSSTFYQWLYNFLQDVFANPDKKVGK